ncbi:hypothetical protein QL285_036795 [Trifolium repens]|nr:hypothetical protein QL285_036795 [Trifolium repens]
MFSMKNVEACLGGCASSRDCVIPICICTALVIPPFSGVCIPVSYKDAVKIVGKNLICQDDTECKNKETENFCIRTSKAEMEYGVCADSIFEAQNLIFKIFSTSKLTKDNFLEITTNK